MPKASVFRHTPMATLSHHMPEASIFRHLPKTSILMHVAMVSIPEHLFMASLLPQLVKSSLLQHLPVCYTSLAYARLGSELLWTMSQKLRANDARLQSRPPLKPKSKSEPRQLLHRLQTSLRLVCSPTL